MIEINCAFLFLQSLWFQRPSTASVLFLLFSRPTNSDIDRPRKWESFFFSFQLLPLIALLHCLVSGKRPLIFFSGFAPAPPPLFLARYRRDDLVTDPF